MKLVRHIANLGYGSRRDVMRMLADRRITRVDGSVLSRSDAFTHEDVRIDGAALDPAPGVVLMLNKPVGYVCSTTDANPVVYDLLPPRFRQRSPIIAPIGRLDRDTSGLLLLTDDGQLNHRITSPRTHLPKTYDARLSTDLRGDEAAVFASGTLMLEGEDRPLRPATLDVLDEPHSPHSLHTRHVRIAITEGRYHQVRRMFAAVGNHVEALHRTAIGDLELGDLPVGEWTVLGSAAEVHELLMPASG